MSEEIILKGDNMNTKRLYTVLISLVVALGVLPAPALSANLPEIKPDKGLVIFYRISRMKGAAMRFEITDTAKGSIGFLSNGTFLHQDLEPGNHTFTVRAPSVNGQDSITLNVEAGKIYYVKGEILWGWPAGRPKFAQMSESQAKADLERFK